MALKNSWKMPLLIFLMGVSTSCAHKLPKDFPKYEIPTMKQPIVEQNFCKDGACEVKSMCNEWKLNDKKDEWVLVANHPLKYCHGIFGITAKEFTAAKTFYEKVMLWIKANIKLDEAAYE